MASLNSIVLGEGKIIENKDVLILESVEMRHFYRMIRKHDHCSIEYMNSNQELTDPIINVDPRLLMRNIYMFPYNALRHGDILYFRENDEDEDRWIYIVMKMLDRICFVCLNDMYINSAPHIPITITSSSLPPDHWIDAMSTLNGDDSYSFRIDPYILNQMKMRSLNYHNDYDIITYEFMSSNGDRWNVFIFRILLRLPFIQIVFNMYPTDDNRLAYQYEESDQPTLYGTIGFKGDDIWWRLWLLTDRSVPYIEWHINKLNT